MKSINYPIVLLLALSSSVFIIGCDQANKDNSTSTSDTNSTTRPNGISASDTNSMEVDNTNFSNHAADNSGINVRDRDTNNLTAGDQGSPPSDIELTQKIRKLLVMDSNYSVTAKNIKIITTNGNVILRGPVNSEAEKTGIETLAKNLAGEGKVDNQLEVKANQ